MKSFRRVIETTKTSQKVEMSIPPLQSSGDEISKEGQKIELVKGEGYILIGNSLEKLSKYKIYIIPKNIRTDIKNISLYDNLDVVIYYTPPKYHPSLDQPIKFN
jgi:hypothetical protein